MKFSKPSFVLISAILFSSAVGARSVITDDGIQIGSGTSSTVSLNPSGGQAFVALPVYSGPPASVGASVAGTITLTGVTSLSFSPGQTFSSYSVDLLPEADQALTTYNFPSFKGTERPPQQVVIDPFPSCAAFTGIRPGQYSDPCSNSGSTSEFALALAYCTGGCTAGLPGSGFTDTASVTVNGITYSAVDWEKLEGSSFTTEYPSFNSTKPELDTLVFVNGVLQDAQYYLDHGWTESKSGPVTAPELDPASAASGLTMLLGSFAVLRGRRARRLAA